MQLATNGQGFVPVHDRVLASVLLALDVPLQTKLVEATGVSPIQNVYSEEHPARVNGRRVHGKTSVLFATHTRDGKIRTRDIIDAWNQVGELSEGDPRTQAWDKINELADRIVDGNLGDEGNRRRLAEEHNFWQVLAIAQAVRVALGHYKEIDSLLADPRSVVPTAQVKRTKGYHFKPLAPSQL